MGSYNIKTTAQRQAMSHSEGQVVYDTDKNTLYYDDGTNWHAVGNAGNPDLEDQPTLEDVQSIVRRNLVANANATFGAVQYAHGVSAQNYAYMGGIYSPNQRRIYMPPLGQATQGTWHYIDCVSGDIVGYDDPSTAMGTNAFHGGAYSPELDRIYFTPYDQSDQANWAYIDCKTGVATAYAHGAGSLSNAAFIGAVHSPTEGKIYLCPYGNSDEAYWFYIDCSDGSVDGYLHGTGLTTDIAFAGGVYDPYNDYVWLVPGWISDEATWYRIDCSDGSVEGYAHGFGTSITNAAFFGGVYDPYNNYIWLIPQGISDEATWYYIRCSDMTVQSYAHGFGTSIVDAAFNAGSYDPTLNRVWMAPYGLADEATWYYIDCDTKVAGSYACGVSASDGAYSGSVFDPINNRTYFTPSTQGAQSNWHYIQSYGKEGVSTQLMAHAMFNKGW